MLPARASLQAISEAPPWLSSGSGGSQGGSSLQRSSVTAAAASCSAREHGTGFCSGKPTVWRTFAMHINIAHGGNSPTLAFDLNPDDVMHLQGY